MKIVQNKYLNALLWLMLFSAGAHMVILVFLAVVHGDLYLLNYFNILDVDLLAGSTFNTTAGNMLAAGTGLAIYLIILKLNQ